jgi:glycosyltransferase involved in cell wall biosynthesis
MAGFVIITPVLNGATYLAATLESIRVQTDPDWVHFLVDGGSTDGSTLSQ